MDLRKLAATISWAIVMTIGLAACGGGSGGGYTPPPAPPAAAEPPPHRFLLLQRVTGWPQQAASSKSWLSGNHDACYVCIIFCAFPNVIGQGYVANEMFAKAASTVWAKMP